MKLKYYIIETYEQPILFVRACNKQEVLSMLEDSQLSVINVSTLKKYMDSKLGENELGIVIPDWFFFLF